MIESYASTISTQARPLNSLHSVRRIGLAQVAGGKADNGNREQRSSARGELEDKQEANWP